MGSKSSDVAAPDPRLVEAQVRSMGYQDDAIQKIAANSDELLPLQKEQLRFGLDTSKVAYDQAQDDREWMLSRRGGLSDVQDTLVNDAKTFNSEERRQQLYDEASADVDSAFSNSRAQGQRGLSRMGVAPGSGRSLVLNGAMDVAQATAKASASQKVRAAARAEGFALTDRAVNALAGYPAMGMAATGAGAGYGASGVGLANSGLAGMNSGYGAEAGAAGSLGSNATGMFGAQASYKLGADKNAMEASAATMNAIGGMAGTAAKVFMGSDRRLKTQITRVGVDDGTGLTIYEFRYKDDLERKFRGVMADEAARYMPEAVVRGSDGYLRVNYAMLGIPFVEVK